jgi:hypothetical protein
MSYADIVKVAYEEALLISGCEDIDEAAKSLLNIGMKILLITDGGNGVRYYSKAGSGFLPTIKANVVDTTGAGDIFFGDAVGAHDAPLVVVATQPNLGDVLKTDIFIDLLGIQMTVVIVDGHFGSVLVVKLHCGGGAQKKIFAQKGFHAVRSFVRNNRWYQYSRKEFF